MTISSFALGRSLQLFSALLLATVLAACGGGGGSAGTPPADAYKLTIDIVGTGAVQSQPAGLNCTANCNADFTRSAVVTLTATPADGQSFTGWSGACTGTTNSCELTMSQAQSATATFAPLAGGQSTFTFSLTINGTGTVASQPSGINCAASCSADFAADTVLTLTATPAAGQSFSGWSGACTGAANTCSVRLDRATSAVATFVPLTGSSFDLSVTVSGTGTVASSPSGINCGNVCTANFAASTAVTLTATPAAGQVFSSWAGACTGSVPTCILQLTQLRNVQAVFTAAPVAGVAFQPGQLLETNNDFNISRGTNLLAVNSSGDSLVVWEQSDGMPDGSTIKVYSRRYQVATGWQAAVAIAGLTRRETNPSLLTGKLLMDDTGVATWINVSLQTRRNSPTTGWGAVFSAPRGDIGGGLTSAVMDTLGGIGVLSSGSNVFHNALVAGASSWGAWQQIDTSGTLVAYRAELALSSNGTALAVWHERNPGDSNYSMKSAHWVRGTGWAAPQSIETLTANLGEESPKVVMDDQGNGVAMWLQNVNGISVFYNIYRTGSGWQGAVQVANPPDRLPALRDMQLSMAGDGRAVATWAGQRSLFSMQYTAASGWSAPVIVTPDFCEQINSSNTKIGDAGQTVTVYVAFNVCEAKTQLVSRSLNIGGQWSAASPIVGGAGGVGRAGFVMNKAAQGVALWVQGDQPGRDQRESLWAAVLR